MYIRFNFYLVKGSVSYTNVGNLANLGNVLNSTSVNNYLSKRTGSILSNFLILLSASDSVEQITKL